MSSISIENIDFSNSYKPYLRAPEYLFAPHDGGSALPYSYDGDLWGDETEIVISAYDALDYNGNAIKGSGTKCSDIAKHFFKPYERDSILKQIGSMTGSAESNVAPTSRLLKGKAGGKIEKGNKSDLDEAWARFDVVINDPAILENGGEEAIFNTLVDWMKECKIITTDKDYRGLRCCSIQKLHTADNSTKPHFRVQMGRQIFNANQKLKGKDHEIAGVRIIRREDGHYTRPPQAKMSDFANIDLYHHNIYQEFDNSKNPPLAKTKPLDSLMKGAYINTGFCKSNLSSLGKDDFNELGKMFDNLSDYRVSQGFAPISFTGPVAQIQNNNPQYQGGNTAQGVSGTVVNTAQVIENESKAKIDINNFESLTNRDANGNFVGKDAELANGLKMVKEVFDDNNANGPLKFVPTQEMRDMRSAYDAAINETQQKRDEYLKSLNRQTIMEKALIVYVKGVKQQEEFLQLKSENEALKVDKQKDEEKISGLEKLVSNLGEKVSHYKNKTVKYIQSFRQERTKAQALETSNTKLQEENSGLKTTISLYGNIVSKVKGVYNKFFGKEMISDIDMPEKIEASLNKVATAVDDASYNFVDLKVNTLMAERGMNLENQINKETYVMAGNCNKNLTDQDRYNGTTIPKYVCSEETMHKIRNIVVNVSENEQNNEFIKLQKEEVRRFEDKMKVGVKKFIPETRSQLLDTFNGSNYDVDNTSENQLNFNKVEKTISTITSTISVDGDGKPGGARKTMEIQEEHKTLENELNQSTTKQPQVNPNTTTTHQQFKATPNVDKNRNNRIKR